MAECDDRDRRRADRRINAAGFPRAKWLEEFDFDANPTINPAVIHPLADLRLGQDRAAALPDRRLRHRQVPPADRAGHRGRDAGYRVSYTLATKLVNELVEAADDKQLSKTIARYGRVDLLCIDELGYMELDRRGAELLFQVLTEREENAPASPSPPTSRSPAGPRPSPTPGSAPPSSTGSPSTATSSRPAPTPTASPMPGPRGTKITTGGAKSNRHPGAR